MRYIFGDLRNFPWKKPNIATVYSRKLSYHSQTHRKYIFGNRASSLIFKYKNKELGNIFSEIIVFSEISKSFPLYGSYMKIITYFKLSITIIINCQCGRVAESRAPAVNIHQLHRLQMARHSYCSWVNTDKSACNTSTYPWSGSNYTYFDPVLAQPGRIVREVHKPL